MSQLAVAAVLLLAIATTAYGQDCWAIETDLKYNIPQGVYGTNGGCIKGSKSADGASCQTPRMDYTRAEGNYGSLSACCAALEPRVQVDPRNGQPRSDQANVKAVCNSYKKTPPASQPTPAPAPQQQQQQGSQECFAIETDLKYMIPLGVYGNNGGCIKGSKSADGSSCQTPRMDYTRAEGNYGSLSACCDALEPRVQVDPRNGQPRSDQANIKAVCNSYKKPAAVAGERATTTKKYLVFKGQDLPAAVDIPSSGQKFSKVCGGKEAVAKACSQSGNCAAFTFGGEGECGYLKSRFYGSAAGSPTLLFVSSNKGWDVFVFEGVISKALGGALDCADGKNSGQDLCKLKAALPQTAGSLSA